MEINPHNAIIVELKKRAAENKAERHVKDLIWLLFETSLLTSGFSLEEPTVYAQRIFRMIKLGLTIEDEPTPETKPTETKVEEKKDTGSSIMEEVD